MITCSSPPFLSLHLLLFFAFLFLPPHFYFLFAHLRVLGSVLGDLLHGRRRHGQEERRDVEELGVLNERPDVLSIITISKKEINKSNKIK